MGAGGQSSQLPKKCPHVRRGSRHGKFAATPSPSCRFPAAWLRALAPSHQQAEPPVEATRMRAGLPPHGAGEAPPAPHPSSVPGRTPVPGPAPTTRSGPTAAQGSPRRTRSGTGGKRMQRSTGDKHNRRGWRRNDHDSSVNRSPPPQLGVGASDAPRGPR